MRLWRIVVLCALTGGSANSLLSDEPASPAVKQVKINEHQFQIPAGFDLELVAGAPLTKWPVVCDWDSSREGSLLVVESAGVEGGVERQLETLPHRLVRLSDKDADGVFDERQIVADKLSFTAGVLSLGSSILVASPPQIWELVDKDGDGVCEERKVWFDGTTLTFCANDLHGPYLGPDGWIYWCKGAFAEQTHRTTTNTSYKESAAAIFRRKFDDPRLEPIITGGMDNPVEVAFTNSGEPFFCSTYLFHPGHGVRDGIAHAVYGGVFGKDHAPIDSLHRTGDLMPVMQVYAAAAPSGLARLKSKPVLSLLDMDADSQVLVNAQFNTQRVAVLELIPTGATYTSVEQSLLVGDRIEFHPTDIIEDADGSLLVIDTGGWYNLCCPSSVVDQDQALGGIYRLSPTQASPVDHRGPAITQATSTRELVDGLCDSRWWMREKCRRVFRESDDPARFELVCQRLGDNKLSSDVRADLMWLLADDVSPATQQVLTAAVRSDDETFATIALHIIALNRLPQVELVTNALRTSESPSIQRAAAEALGRIGNAASLTPILDTLVEIDPADRHLEHSLLYALMELNLADECLQHLSSTNPIVQRATLRVVHETAPELLSPTLVADLAASSDSSVASIAIEILADNAQWAETSSEMLAELFAKSDDDRAMETLSTLVRSWRESTAVQNAIIDIAKDANTQPAKTQQRLAELLHILRLGSINDDLQSAIASWLESADADTERDLLRLLSDAEWTTTNAGDSALVQQLQKRLAKTPLTVLPAMPVGFEADSVSRVAILDGLSDEQEERRTLALRTLQRVRIDRQLGSQLLEYLPRATPTQLQVIVEAISQARNEELDKETLALLRKLPAAPSLDRDFLVGLYRESAADIQDLAKLTANKLSEPPSDIAAEIVALNDSLPSGDVARGFQVFRSAKAACSSCHTVGYVGGTIGPELTRIGSARTRLDLLEAIAYPNLRIEPSYKSTQVLTEDDELINGMIVDESASTLTLRTATDQTVDVAKSNIAERKISPNSLMPSGLAKTLTPQELADLLEMLEHQRSGYWPQAR